MALLSLCLPGVCSPLGGEGRAWVPEPPDVEGVLGAAAGSLSPLGTEKGLQTVGACPTYREAAGAEQGGAAGG